MPTLTALLKEHGDHDGAERLLRSRKREPLQPTPGSDDLAATPPLLLGPPPLPDARNRGPESLLSSIASSSPDGNPKTCVCVVDECLVLESDAAPAVLLLLYDGRMQRRRLFGSNLLWRVGWVDVEA